jgi:hypothetical protein
LFSGRGSVSTVPAGSAAKASLVGAKTVKGPGTLERLDEARGLDGGHKRRVVGRVHRVGDDVVGGGHLGPADHRVLLREGGGG